MNKYSRNMRKICLLAGCVMCIGLTGCDIGRTVSVSDSGQNSISREEETPSETKSAKRESYTVEFYYTRKDKNYEGYTIKPYIDEVGNETATFEKKDGKGYCYYRFNREPDMEEIHFSIQTYDNNTLVLQYSCDLLDNEENYMRINIDGDTNEITFGGKDKQKNGNNKDNPFGIFD